jgi:peptidoglycan L-alanyl-D-glutamate endopeptidase CwlK
MARDAVASLKRVIQPQVREFESRCADEGLDVLIYCGLRSPEEQARLWRVGRSRAKIDETVLSLRAEAADLVSIPPLAAPSSKMLQYAALQFADNPAFHAYPRPDDCILTARFSVFMASHIDMAGPQRGTRRVTNACPGQSVHQYGLAFDAVPTLGGKPLWDDADALDDMGAIGEECGFEWAGRWRTFQEFVHFQAVGWKDTVRGQGV